MKKLISILLALSMLCSLTAGTGLSVYAGELASSGSCGANATYTFDSATGTLTISGSGEMYSSYSNPPYYNNSSIKEIIIEEGINAIYSLGENENLVSVSLPSTLTKIGNSAFFNCKNLKEVTFHNGLTYIGDYSFEKCESLENAIIPDTVTYLGENAFEQCFQLKNVRLSSSLTEIKRDTFWTCSSLESIVIPDSVKTIGSYAFAHCALLSEVDLGNGIETLKTGAFGDCPLLTEWVLPDSLINFDYAFGDNNPVVSLSVGKSWDGTYTGQLKNLTTLIVRNGGVSIADSFLQYDNYAPKLTSVYLPGNIVVASKALQGAPNLKYVFFAEDENEYYLCMQRNNKLMNAQYIHYNGVGHVFTEEQVTAAPTCTKDGVITMKCCYCDQLGQETKPIPATGHDYSDSVFAPGCVTRGYTYHRCKVCGAFYNDTFVPATGHNYISELTTAPTCEEEGVCTYTCTVCHESYEESVPATGHDYEVTTVEPTCTKTGKKVYRCKNDASHTYTEELNAFGHDYRSNVVEPTCINNGYTTYTCTRCGDTYRDDYTPLAEHQYRKIIVKLPSCVEYGTEKYVCSVCGDTYEESTLPLGHSLVTEPAIAPDCTHTGLTEGIRCERCGTWESAQKTIPALGHNYNAAVTAPTCLEQGYTTYTCSRCGDTYTDDVTEALGHDATAEVTEPTCFKTGYTTFTCKRCGAVYTGDYTEALGHDYVPTVTEPTCLEQGYTTYTCSRCGDTYTGNATAALGHDYVPAVTEPTCLEEGYTTYTCSRCGDAYTGNATVALGHDYIPTVTEPTCLEQGYTTHTCSRCDDSYIDAFTEALGHAWGEWRVTQEPTEEAEGRKESVCIRCGEIQEEALPCLPHQHQPAAPVKENEKSPTCTAEGSYELVTYCAKCGEKLSSESVTVPMTEHRAVKDAAVSPTCTAPGKTQGLHCADCNEILEEQNEIPATGHQWNEGDIITPATYEASGEAVYTCTVCGVTKTEVLAKLEHRGKFVIPTVTSRANREIEVEIFIDNNPGITSLSLEVDYPEGFTLIDAEDCGLFRDGVPMGELSTKPFPMLWYSAASATETANGRFVKLRFAIDPSVGKGDYPITVTYDQENTFIYKDGAFEEVPFDNAQGIVTVIDSVPGDLNKDDKINMLDIVLFQKYLNKWDVTMDTEAADVNDDGKINMKDLVLINQYICGWGVVLK